VSAASFEIHLVDTVAARRRWYQALEDDGKL
jgi:hypothetical protein